MASFSRPARLAVRSRRQSEVVLHVGRNKAGSTTIQDFCLEQRAELRVRGVEYVMFGHLAASQPGVTGFVTFDELVSDLQARPGARRLVSNEFMFGWPDEFTEDAAQALAGVDVQIIVYLRRYDQWVASAYAEETRRGMNMRGIDDYLAWLGPRVSAWPHLRKWGECFGWDRVRVRDLAPAALRRGDLLIDFLHELGLRMEARGGRRSNVAPHWIELELIRRLAERNGETEWTGVDREVVEPLLAELRPLLAGAAPAAYLSLSQRRSLLDLYNEDLGRIRGAGGGRLAAVRADLGPERPFAPSLERVADEVLRAFFMRTAQPAFLAAHPQAGERARRLRNEMAPRLGAAAAGP